MLVGRQYMLRDRQASRECTAGRRSRLYFLRLLASGSTIRPRRSRSWWVLREEFSPTRPAYARTVCSAPCVACQLPTSLSPAFPPAHFHPSVGLAFRHPCPPRVRCASRCAATACAAMSSSARPSAERRRSVEVSRNGTGEPPAMRYSSTSKKSGLLLKRGKFLHRDGMFLLHKKSRFLVLEGPKLSCYKKVSGWGC